MKNALTLIVISCILLGCHPINKSQKTIFNGMKYSEALKILNSQGLKESESSWDMMISPDITLHTFIISKDKALLVNEEKKTGTISSMEIYGNIDKPKAYRTSEMITEYEN